MKGLPKWLICKESAHDAEDAGETMRSIPGLGRSPGGGHGNPLQYSCLGESHGQRSWQATVHGVTQRWTQLKRLSTHPVKILHGLEHRLRNENHAFFSPQNVFYIIEIGANI